MWDVLCRNRSTQLRAKIYTIQVKKVLINVYVMKPQEVLMGIKLW